MKRWNEMHLALIAALIIGAVSLSSYSWAQPAGCGDVVDRKPLLVYSRQLRDLPAKPYTPRIEDGSNWQVVFNDVFYVLGNATEYDLVLDDNGKITTVYNCEASKEICAAGEPAVSPDGTKIIFSVIRGDTMYPVEGFNFKTFKALRSELWLLDLLTGVKKRISPADGFMYRFPTFRTNEDILFVANRSMVYPPRTLSQVNDEYTAPSLQLYASKLDMKDMKNLTPDAAMVMSPTVLHKGDICYSRYEGWGLRSTGHTPGNFWWGVCTDGNGASTWSELGAHVSPVIDINRYTKGYDAVAEDGYIMSKAIRPLVELRKGVMGFAWYYRANSLGACGMLGEYDYNGPLAEGVTQAANFPLSASKDTRKGTGKFFPSSLRITTPFSVEQDANEPNRLHGKATGRACFPAPYLNGYTLITRCRGWCFAAADVQPVTKAYMGGEPTAKKEIAIMKVPVVTDPFDPKQLETIACADEKYHCWDAKAVVPYKVLFGQDMPTQQPPLNSGKTMLVVGNFFKSELEQDPDKPEPLIQGNADKDYATKAAKFRIELVKQWPTVPTRDGFYSRKVYKDVAPDASGSLSVEVPCETPFLMGAIDKDGKVVAQDNMLHSLRCGEVRTCLKGCHVHSEEAL